MAESAVLQNHLVLQEIFSKLKVRDVSHCRQVCSRWNPTATKLLLRKIDEIETIFKVPTHIAYPNFDFGRVGETATAFVTRVKNSDLNRNRVIDVNLSQLPKYISYMDTNPLLRYSNFKFELELTQLTKALVDDFFSRCGRDVNILKLRLFHKYASDSEEEDDEERAELISKFGAGLRRIFIKCPNLIHLSIDSMPGIGEGCSLLTQDERRSGSLPPFCLKKLGTLEIREKISCVSPLLRDLCLLCTNLKTAASICDLHCRGHSSFRDIQFLDCLSSGNRFQNLEALTLSHADAQLLQRLESFGSRLRLKSLKLNTFYPIGAEEDLFRFLSSQHSSLEKLRIWFTAKKFRASTPPPGANGSPIVFPVLENLRVFGLAVEDEEIRFLRMRVAKIIKFAELNISHQFPKLEKLLLPQSFVSEYLPQLFVSGRPQLNTLKELKLPSGISKEMMGRIGELFPELLKLTSGYQTDLVFSQIWTLWPALESLSLCVNGTDGQQPDEFLGLDGLLTGIEGVENPSARRESIANLQSLRELVIHSGPSRKGRDGKCKDKITDVTVNCALRTLQNLRFLQINDDAISPDSISELTTCLPRATISLEDEDEDFACKMCAEQTGKLEKFWK